MLLLGRGGFVAQEVVLLRPRLVRRLILAGIGPQGGHENALTRADCSTLAVRSARLPARRRHSCAAPGGSDPYAGCPNVVVGYLRLDGAEGPYLLPTMGSMQDRANGLPRIPVIRTRVNKHEKKAEAAKSRLSPRAYSDMHWY